MEAEERFMRRAIELAKHGRLDASPNPMVGAVITDNHGNIIGEGWHRRCGEAHAEVNAVQSVAETDRSLLGESTIYVTLEPCAHYGKTPPCAKLIADMKIPRVVVGSVDPFAKVSGRGITMLREAGAEVIVGMLEEECRAINPKFFTAHTLKRPFITLKWAESSDGFIDGKISTPLTSVAVHKLRATHDAILVGSGTWEADSPRLDTRLFAGKSPARFIADRSGKVTDVPEDITILTDTTDLAGTMRYLYEAKGITSILVEGGSRLLQSFLEAGLFDRIRIERSHRPLSGKVKAPVLPSGIRLESCFDMDGNQIIEYSN